jgi:tetratricopeptide (TPR) repeat protein
LTIADGSSDLAGWAKGAAGQSELSTVDLNNAMRLDRNMVGALSMQRGNVLRAARQYDRAISRAIGINSNWPLAYFGRGASFEGKGDSGRAIADYRKSIELNARTGFERQVQQQARERLQKLGRL